MNNLKKFLVSIMVISSVCACSMIGGGSKEATELLKRYYSASINVVQAQTEMNEVFKIKDDSDAIRKGLEAGNIDPSEVNKYVERTNKILEDKMQNAKLDAEEKVKVAHALGKYGKGVLNTVQLGKAANDFVKTVNKAKGAQKAQMLAGDGQTAFTVATGLPSFSKNLITTGNKFVKYANYQGVDTSEIKKSLSEAVSFDPNK